MTPNPQDSAVALEVELLSCPFCGHEAPYFERTGTSGHSCIVVCGYCGARHESSDEYERSGSSWNTRASQSDGTSGGWISVDERLPAHEQEVICSGFEGNDPTKKRWQEFAVFHREGLFYNRETGDDYYPPTHWREMPALPAAPNQGENHVG